MTKYLFIPVVSALLLGACSSSSQTNKSAQDLQLLQTPIPTEEPISTPFATAAPINESSPAAQPTSMKIKENAMTQATIHTAKGDIVLELYPDKAPGTVSNFEKKIASNYYNNLTFHRVESWVVQGGDPLGNGTGGGSMPTELNDVAFAEGSLGVARGGDIKVSNDSQFFICTEDCSWLNGQYTNFGKVTKGMDVVKQIAIGDKIESISLTK